MRDFHLNRWKHCGTRRFVKGSQFYERVVFVYIKKNDIWLPQSYGLTIFYLFNGLCIIM